MTQQQYRRRQQREQLRRQRAILSGIVLFLVTVGILILILFRPEEERTEPAARAEARAGTLPVGWERRRTTERELSGGALALVNAEYDFDPELPRTVSVYANKTDSYLVKDTELAVREELMPALNAWLGDFSAETGKTDVNVVAGWRSLADQERLYQNAVNTKGQAHADAYLALPGRSEHHTGLAVDLGLYDVETGSSADFTGEGVYARAVERAWEYGFVRRYPPDKREITGIDYESWHFRWVGLPHSYVMQTENLCLEEYVAYLRGFPFSGEHLRVTCLGTDYELYFCPKDRLVVPSTGNYTVCGNNADGFAVVLERSRGDG